MPTLQLKCVPEIPKVSGTFINELATSMMVPGAKGTVAAGLVPLCVKKLVEEEKPQLKV